MVKNIMKNSYRQYLASGVYMGLQAKRAEDRMN
jgi:hypothetical protein